ncbi:MAG: hypothetical protein AAFY15_08780 [Cyanobacteria bacterium J06648_11]
MLNANSVRRSRVVHDSFGSRNMDRAKATKQAASLLMAFLLIETDATAISLIQSNVDYPLSTLAIAALAAMSFYAFTVIKSHVSKSESE